MLVCSISSSIEENARIIAVKINVYTNKSNGCFIFEFGNALSLDFESLVLVIHLCSKSCAYSN